MVTNGDNGTIGANCANDDQFEKIMIHWSYKGCNGDNLVRMTTKVSMSTMVSMATMVTTISMMIVETSAPMATKTI